VVGPVNLLRAGGGGGGGHHALSEKGRGLNSGVSGQEASPRGGDDSKDTEMQISKDEKKSAFDLNAGERGSYLG